MIDGVFTNNRAELYAMIRAVEIFTLFKLKKSYKNHLLIHTDSRLCINIMTKWLNKWKLKGWKKADGKEPLNTDLIIRLDNIINKNKKKFTVEYKYVKAHKKKPRDKTSEEYYYWYGNHMADKLARNGSIIHYKNNL